jgi:hypothetical protein
MGFFTDVTGTGTNAEADEFWAESHGDMESYLVPCLECPAIHACRFEYATTDMGAVIYGAGPMDYIHGPVYY